MAIKRRTELREGRRPRVRVPTVKIALLGFGTVGSSVARVLAASKFPGVELTHIFNRNVARKRASERRSAVPASVVWTENIDDHSELGADIVVELMGG